jgi:hypothetical protein
MTTARDSWAVAAQYGAGGRWLLALTAMLAASCGGGGSKAAAPTTTVPAATTTTVDPKQQVIAAYENYVAQYSRVSDDPNGTPNDPQLTSTMTPKLAQQVSLNILGIRRLHQYTKGPITVHPQSVNVQGSSATLLTCNRDDSDLYDQTGHDISPHPGVGTPEQLSAILVLTPDRRWLVDQNSSTGTGCTA